ncbi:unnamed protein product [Parascedosporium putredinis]|uniref:Uncharacterized protein n=1 Tax=Parascedosporium putredinis TaxID=1442378 RepID=A0A9P1HBS6_9PEZI|nr:unnamed protein product [Parascedosporium putredinis]CAI8003555.1 unnamed protein product [Parascedosporium putredinis]
MGLKLGLVLLPQRLAVLLDQEGYGDESKRDEAEQAVAPADAELLVHFEAGERPDDGVGGEGGGGVDGVGVDEVHLQGKHDDEDGDADEDVADDGDDPVDLFRRGETVLGLHALGGNTGLGGLDLGLRRAFFDVAIRGDGEEDDANHGTHAEAEEDEADVGGGEAVGEGEDLGDGGEHEVEVAVDNTEVEGEDDGDGVEHEELARADDAVDKEVARGEAGVELGAEQRVASFLAEAGRLALEKDGGIGLAHKDGHADGEHGDGNGEDPEDPAPALGVGKETSGNGADDGTEQGTDAEDGHGDTALFLRNHVGDGTGAVGAEDAAEEAECDEGGEGGGEGAGDDEDSKEDEGGEVDPEAAVDLGERGESERSCGETEDVDGDDKGSEEGAAALELDHDLGHTGSKHGYRTVGRVLRILGPVPPNNVFVGDLAVRNTLLRVGLGRILVLAAGGRNGGRGGGAVLERGAALRGDGLAPPLLAALVEDVANVGGDVGVVALGEGELRPLGEDQKTLAFAPAIPRRDMTAKTDRTATGAGN